MATTAPDVGVLLALERTVWDALVSGDVEADRAALSPGFLGVGPDGFGDRDGHVSRIATGPTVVEYRLAEARTVPVADGHVIVSYLATYRRPGQDAEESMYVSSLWSDVDGRWSNVFSQDTPVGEPVV